jgi:hypothetical protein
LESDQAQAALLRGACTIAQAETGLLYLLREPGASCVTRKALGEGIAWDDRSELELQPGLVAECILTGLPQRYGGDSSDAGPRPGFDLPEGWPVDSFLCAPLLKAGTIAGAIALVNKRGGHFDELDEAVQSQIAGAMAAAWERPEVEALKRLTSRLEIKRRELLRSRNTLRALFDNTPHRFISSIRVHADRHQHEPFQPDRQTALAAGRRPVLKACTSAAHPARCMALRPSWPAGDTAGSSSGCRNSGCRSSGRRKRPRRRDRDQHLSNLQRGGETVQAILFEDDVTEKRRLSASLAQSEKLARRAAGSGCGSRDQQPADRHHRQRPACAATCRRGRGQPGDAGFDRPGRRSRLQVVRNCSISPAPNRKRWRRSTSTKPCAVRSPCSSTSCPPGRSAWFSSQGRICRQSWPMPISSRGLAQPDGQPVDAIGGGRARSALPAGSKTRRFA